MAVMTALPRYQEQGRPFMAFVYGIASHKVADAMRVAGRVRSDPVEDVPETFTGVAGPEQRALDADAGRQMRELLELLPEKQREVLVLRPSSGCRRTRPLRSSGPRRERCGWHSTGHWPDSRSTSVRQVIRDEQPRAVGRP